jgi:hypothetical protein
VRELADTPSILALVEERAGLLPVLEVDHERHTVLAHHGAHVGHVADDAGDVFGLPTASGSKEHGRHAEGNERCGERWKDVVPPRSQTVIVDDHDGNLAVSIDDETGHAVSFPVDHAVGGGLFRSKPSGAKGDRLCETLANERAIDGMVAVRPHPNRKRSRLCANPVSNDLVLERETHVLTVTQLRSGELLAINPRMTATYGLCSAG